MTLSGCNNSFGSKLARVQIDPLEPRLAAECYTPTIKAGEHAKLWAARAAGALAACRLKHHDTVAVYNDLRERLK